MSRKFRETVDTVLDTSRLFGIISHIERVVFEGMEFKVCAVLYYLKRREALSHPLKTHHPGLSELPLGDDSQFFATTLNLPDPTGKVCPANLID